MRTPKTTIKQAIRIAKMMTLIGCILMLSAAVAQAATYHVTTTADNGDNLNPTPGSLRMAIIDANADAGADTIDFQIPGAGVQTISPPTPFPALVGSVTIDGYTQAGASENTLAVGNNAVLLIELSGTNLGNGFDAIGLALHGGGSTIRGLVINRFGYYGIMIESDNPGGNKIEGCFIGTDPTGTLARSNDYIAVLVNESDNNTIGGTSPAARNIISGNGDPNKFTGTGIYLSGGSNKPVTGTVIQGNYFGTDATGTAKLGNVGTSLVLASATSTIIGGTTVAARNVISGSYSGIVLGSSTLTLVQGNYIGTDATGLTALGNTEDGIRFDNAADNTIGGATAGARNIISGTQNIGIQFYGNSSTGNVIQGNYIGTDVTGNAALPNDTGISMSQQSPSNNKIGGTAVGEGNLISGNNSTGILIGGKNPTNNVIQGNFIGTNAAGTAALPNGSPVNKDGAGILIFVNTGGNLIGGITAGARNVISGNNGFGLKLFQASNQQIQGNYIGVNVNGAALGNANIGIATFNGSQNNTIGGTVAGAGNIIAFNSFQGISLTAAGDTGNAILGNAIYSNDGQGFGTGLGIDLFGNNGVSPNDAGDTDTKSNNLQNYPVITSAMSSNGSTNITATLNSEVNKQYRIEFFANAQCDPTGFGEGQIFLGATSAMTVGNDANINATLPVTVPAGYFITATATDTAGNTSEFSQCLLLGSIAGQSTLQFSTSGYNVNENAGTVTITVTRAGGNSSAVSVHYSNTSGGDAAANTDYTTTSGTLNWAAGDSSNKTFTIPIANDTLDELDEFFKVSLDSPTGNAVVGNQATASVTIIDDDAPPTISIQDASVTESNSGIKPLNFNVTLSAASGKSVQVSYSTIAGGTATSGVDYESVSNSTITFNPGQTAKTATVNLTGDTTHEPDETFFVQLSNPTDATLNKAQATGTILNDDNAPPPPTALQFTQASYTVGEGAGSITITVERTGNTSTPASVDYTTMDSSAQQRSDFNIALGRLSFAAGETSKNFSIFITDDAYVEGQESFSLSLSNPSGALLGAQAMSVVTINDNDSQATANNPIDSADFFIRQHYVDFLNREPEPSGLADWEAILNNCAPGDSSCDRIQVSSAFFRSPEFYDRGYFVYRFYETALGRKPDYLEFMPGLTKVTGFLTPQELEAAKAEFISGFMSSQEYKQKYDQILDAGVYVDTLAQTAGVTLSNRDALVLALETNQKTRAQVLREVVESAEVGAKFYNKAFVVMQYFGYLRRDPDALYLNWIETLNQTGDYRLMVNGFMNSPEYRARFNQ